ncbi:MAG: hypothetical protein ACP5I4_10560 [Oceanipulchritudo sp.]
MMKRTTLILEDGVFEGVKEVSHRRRVDMSKVVNEWLSAGLQREKATREAPVALPQYAMGRPRVNLADRDGLEAAMEG